MLKTTVSADGGALSVASPEPKRHLTVDPSELPDRYAMICEGVCLEPEIADGTRLLFDKHEPFGAGDLVVLFRRPELVQPGHHQAIVKRLVMAPPPWVKFPWRENPRSEVRALVIAEQINPRRQYAIPCEDLLGIHKCLGPVPADMVTYPVTDDEIRRQKRRRK